MELLIIAGVILALVIVVGWVAEDVMWFLESAGLGCAVLAVIAVIAVVAWGLGIIR